MIIIKKKELIKYLKSHTIKQASIKYKVNYYNLMNRCKMLNIKTKNMITTELMKELTKDYDL